MPILEQDIQIMASQVLDDVPEGGGAATGTVVADGVSNNLFPDVSELDRVYGRVQLRKVFPSVRTEDTDRYSGANVIVVDPPDDPAVSTVLFNTADSFDTRDQAAARIQAYLSIGPEYRGLLFGNHIAGQMNVTLIQRVGTELPSVGETLVLRKNEGLSNQFDQYVRITQVSSVETTFEDASGEFKRLVVTLSISDQLLQDFPGFGAVRQDASVGYTGKTHAFQTIVADAARYYGVAVLDEAITLGSYVAQVDDIYSQLVPSTRTETPIADARMNQQTAALMAAGSDIITGTASVALGPAQSLFIGGGIAPGSLQITSGLGITLTDSGGKLYNGTIEVGTVDYAGGVVTAASLVTSGTLVYSYRAGGAPTVVSESIDLPVTAANQRLTYTLTLDPVPAAGTLGASYMSQGRWYTLSDDGSGALRGSDSSVGAGTLNFTTGTVTLTLGALPDVRSSVIMNWGPGKNAQVLAPVDLGMNQRFFHVVTVGKAIKPGTLTLSWNDGSARSASDDSNGALTGYAAGKVFYAKGEVWFSPNALPAPGTTVTVGLTETQQVSSEVANFGDGGTTWTATLGTPVKAGTLELSLVTTQIVRVYPGVDSEQSALLRAYDNGAGAVKVATATGTLTIGSINYGTGALVINKQTSGYVTTQGVWAERSVLGEPVSNVYVGQENRSLPIAVINGDGDDLSVPAWAWWSGAQTAAAKVRYAGADLSSESMTFPFTTIRIADASDLLERPATAVTSIDKSYVVAAGGSAGSGSGGTVNGLIAPVNMTSLLVTPGYSDLSIQMGSSTYVSRQAGSVISIIRNPSASTGEGLVVGTMSAYTRLLQITAWDVGANPTILRINGTKVTPVDGPGSNALVDRVTFRTASAPLAPTGFNLVGTFVDGSGFNVIADDDGYINDDGVIGFVDYQTGVVRVVFGDPVGAPGDGVIDQSDLGVPGVSLVDMRLVRADTLRYNAVAYTYIPLSADILGLDPVRLPADGRVPIFRAGSVAVVHNTQTTAPATVSNGQTISTGRVRLSRVRVIGNNGVTIETGYTVNKNAGTVTFTDVTGYSQPVRIEHRIEDMALVADAQISGLLRFTRPITHAYPADTSFVSSALLLGDMKARVSSVFDQTTWTGVWSDDVIGSPATGTYDTINYPPQIENFGAVDERWYLRFISTSGYEIVGEHLGVVGAGNTSTGAAPINPATGTPYFTLLPGGFGIGWSVGNVIRINTVGAIKPVWIARVTQQSEPTALSDSFTMAVRGDVDTP